MTSYSTKYQYKSINPRKSKIIDTDDPLRNSAVCILLCKKSQRFTSCGVCVHHKGKGMMRKGNFLKWSLIILEVERRRRKCLL